MSTPSPDTPRAYGLSRNTRSSTRHDNDDEDGPSAAAAPAADPPKEKKTHPALAERLFSCLIDLLFCCGFTLPAKIQVDHYKINYIIWSVQELAAMNYALILFPGRRVLGLPSILVLVMPMMETRLKFCVSFLSSCLVKSTHPLQGSSHALPNTRSILFKGLRGEMF